MATQSPISTISYNTEAFLKEKLQIWLNAHIIQAYQYICHKGEDGDKDHIHLRIEPNKRIDQMDLSAQLKEYPIGSEKPLGCRPWRPSKEEDWILYVVHDKEYLKQKYGGGEKGEKLPYEWTDIRCPEDYDMEIAFIRAKAKMEHTSASMASRMQQGTEALSLVLQGENIFKVNALMRTLNATDYERLSCELRKANDYINKLEYAIKEANLTIIANDDGSFQIHKGE